MSISDVTSMYGKVWSDEILCWGGRRNWIDGTRTWRHRFVWKGKVESIIGTAGVPAWTAMFNTATIRSDFDEKATTARQFLVHCRPEETLISSICTWSEIHNRWILLHHDDICPDWYTCCSVLGFKLVRVNLTKNSVRIGTSLRDPLDPCVLASITAQEHHNSDGALRSSPTGTQRNMNNPTVIINPKECNNTKRKSSED